MKTNKFDSYCKNQIELHPKVVPKPVTIFHQLAREQLIKRNIGEVPNNVVDRLIIEGIHHLMMLILTLLYE